MSAVAIQFQRLIYYISQYYLTPICTLGIIGNIANIIVFSHRLLRINGCSWYFLAVSFVHLNVLTFGSLVRLVIIYTKYDLTIISPIFCKIRSYFVFNGFVLSRYFLCVIAIDRWMISSRSESLRRQSNPRRARQVIVISSIIWLLFNLFIPVGFQPERSGCVPISDSFYLLMYTIVNLFATFTPFIILILFSILTIRNVLKSGAVRNQVRNVAVVVVHPIGNIPQHRRRKNKDWQLIRLSLIQVLAFILLNISNIGYTLYQFITKTDNKSLVQGVIDVFIVSIVDNLNYTHCALTFYLYTLSSQEFRKVCWVICRHIYLGIKTCFY